MKASYYKNLLLVLMCLCITGVHGEEYEWTNIQGKTIKAGFVSATNEAVAISMQGKNFEVKFTDLVPDSVALAKRLQGAVKEGLQVKNEGLVLGESFSICVSFSQNSMASSHETFSTGRVAPLNLLGFDPITFSHWACVTSCFPR